MNDFLYGAAVSAALIVWLVLVLGRVPDHKQKLNDALCLLIYCLGFAGVMYIIYVALLKYGPWAYTLFLTR